MDVQYEETLDTRLKRIEGQIRGIRKMLDEGRYCTDVLTQTASVMAALRSVEKNILERHLNSCVADAFSGADPEEKEEKIREVMYIISRFGRNG